MSERDYPSGWNTAEELNFLRLLEMTGRRKALAGYAASLAARTRWKPIDPKAVAMWLRTRKLLPGSVERIAA